ncbi:MAG: cellulose synthase subunit BcsC-related outer membrane protein [Terracidiphilus sp.]|nr:cellulose synthase subunit BcsC-related outer membrane protein [Terracidiphilus sp.]
METPMRVGWLAGRTMWIAAGCLALALQVGYAQKKPVANSANGARTMLIEKAHALDSRGRPDMAIQLWQQILLSDPNNAEALAGLARDLKLTGSSDQASRALDRLRKINPNDPSINRIQSLSSTKGESDQLRKAGELARQGKVDDAMRLYRQLYGENPPDGDIALAYYQTMYGTSTGKTAAIAGMRALAARNPGDSRYAVQLGVMLTYDQKTRSEGIRLLSAHPRDTNAQTALRQALIWDAANPATAAELRTYLKDHPQDSEIAGHLKQNEAKLAQMNSGIARTPAERAAFAALNGHRIDEAQQRFSALLDEDPKNGRAAAGMGFLRMQQKNFGGAISYLTQAEQNGFKDRSVESALSTSRFWYVMGEASLAFDENRLDVAEAKYKAALVMNPRSPEALTGLAGLLVKAQQYQAAEGVYEQLLKVQPGNEGAWRGLFLAYARDDQNQKAMAVMGRLPGGVRASLGRDPEYLRTLAGIYQAEHRNADAQHVLAQALALPFPNNGTTLKNDTKLQYAGILMEARRFAQASELYEQVLAADAGNQAAWMGLISSHHELGDDTLAIAEVQKMPPAAYEAALGDPGFLSMLAAMYQQANQFEVAQSLLERSMKLQIAAGGQPSVALQSQLASIYLRRNDTQRAYGIYHQLLQSYPQRADAWKGLITTLQATNRNTEALQEIAQIPAAPRKELEGDIDFIQMEASLYAATGETRRAMEYMTKVEQHYARLKQVAPAPIEVQNAWLLYNTGNDRALYLALMKLGGRNDLTPVQRRTVQEIWASWSVRRAGTALENGNARRAVDILDAAYQAFPDNEAVRKAVAGGYSRVGRAKDALAIFKTVPMQDATSGDFQGAVGAALTANDKAQAEIWLRQALDRYPRDSAVLQLAARYEQARGDNQRAAEYYRASLAAMPSASPVDRLAHTLAYPEQDSRPHKAVTAADLQRLLDPSNEPFQKTNKLPPLPAYGADPYDGSAPIVLRSQRSSAASHAETPTSAEPPNYAPTSNPAVNVIPAAQPDSQQLMREQSAVQYGDANPDSDGQEGTLHLRPAINFAGGFSATQPMQRQARVITLKPVDPEETGEPGPRAGELRPVVLQAAGGDFGQAPIQMNPPHSVASDAWKGLIFSLVAGNRNDDALSEMAKVPPDVRRQLEADIEFVQGIASLYVAVGDVPHAMAYLNRVEEFYTVRRTLAPARLEIQHAWLLYNLQDDPALYPVLNRLDTRTDITPAQRQEVEGLWATWAVRRANTAMTNGNLLRGVLILQAASQDYPDNITVRRAVAGAYARVGRANDALTLFKTLPMDNASSGDYQGAISAALGATDMAQAEAWLRQALDKFGSDPQILALAARFEQARSNNERAIDYWRASIAAMPQGSSVKSLDSYLSYPPGTFKAPLAGDTKRLLDPRADPAPQTIPLPAYPRSSGRSQSITTAPRQTVPATPTQPQWIQPPSNNPLPPPPMSGVSHPEARYDGPAYVPQAQRQAALQSRPVLIEQSATQVATFLPAMQWTQLKAATPKKKSGSRQSYEGHMNLPADQQYVGTAAQDAQQAPLPSAQQAPVWTPKLPALNAPQATGLRITSQPMENLAAESLARFAEQTDSQLTQGSATVLRSVPLTAQAPVRIAPVPAAGGRAQSGQYDTVQYTPSAQEAVTGAYSSSHQENAAPVAQPQPRPVEQAKPAPLPAVQEPVRTTRRSKRRAAQTLGTQDTRTARRTAATDGTPVYREDQTTLPYSAQSDLPAQQTQTPSTGAGLTDEELQQRNLPPLRGPWVRVQRDAHPISPREQAEMQLQAIESGYSSWLGGTGLLSYRSGSLGFDHLTAMEAPFEASLAGGYHARITIVAKPVFLDSGQADGTAQSTVLASSTSGTTMKTIPQPIGTLTATDTTPPAQQNAVGLGGEVQLSFPHLSVAMGSTPYGFLVQTFTARFLWKPGNGPFTFNFNRDSVKDSQLSYSGLRDPAGNSLGTLGQIWGGVVANSGSLQYARGDEQSGFYMSAGGQYLTGYKVADNKRIDGAGGAYWRLWSAPEYGRLNVGVNFFAMHYDKNMDAFTHGMGGYFSPQGYFLANVPFTWTGHYMTNWHYTVAGGLGVQAFQENQTKLWPLVDDTALETAEGNPLLPDKTSVGSNYDLHGQVSYQVSPHWFAGGYMSANNTRNYSSFTAGFFVRFLFREQPSTATAPTGLFPSDGIRPFTVP